MKQNKYCPLNNFKTICDKGCAFYNEGKEECSILTISKELSRMEYYLTKLKGIRNP